MPRLIDILTRNFTTLIRFGVTGIVATSVTLFALYVLADVLGLWYVYATTIAFLLGFGVSFILQKFWTFEDSRMHVAGVQAIMYFIIILFNVCLNAMLMYALVEWVHLSHLVAQLISAAIIACESFFAYRLLVFRDNVGIQKI